MALGSSRWYSTVLSWSLSLQSSHWSFGVGCQHFSHWIFLCGLHKFGCGQSLEWGWLHLHSEAALLVYCVRTVILFPSRGSGRAPHSWEAERAGKRAMISQERKRCLVILPGGIPLWTCFGCRWTFGKPQLQFLLSLLYLWPHLLTYYELFREKKLLSNSQCYRFSF